MVRASRGSGNEPDRTFIDQARIDLERTQIKAPFDGVVSDLRVSQGDRTRAGDPLMRLQNPASIEVRTQIPARYAEIVTGGIARDEAMMAIVQIGEQRVMGQLTRISGQTREASGGVDSLSICGSSRRNRRISTVWTRPKLIRYSR